MSPSYRSAVFMRLNTRFCCKIKLWYNTAAAAGRMHCIRAKRSPGKIKNPLWRELPFFCVHPVEAPALAPAAELRQLSFCSGLLRIFLPQPGQTSAPSGTSDPQFMQTRFGLILIIGVPQLGQLLLSSGISAPQWGHFIYLFLRSKLNSELNYYPNVNELT